MRSYLVLILIIMVMFILSCRENNEFTDVTNPSIGGNYTVIKGNISGTLTIENSPFLINEDIQILNGKTLVINPGVTLFFEKDSKLIVEGAIIAIGTSQNPITFTSYSQFWSGIIIINSTDTSKFKFCTIQNVYKEIDDTLSSGAIEINNANLILENSVVKMNSSIYGGGLLLAYSSGIFKNNIFRENDAEIFGGAMVLQNSTAVIINNTIYNNSSFNVGGGVAILDPVSIELQNNIFYENLSFNGGVDPNILILSGDSSSVHENYNYLAIDTMNPMFTSYENLHLSSQSPCIDNGNPDTIYNDFNNTRNDQGAFGGPGGNW